MAVVAEPNDMADEDDAKLDEVALIDLFTPYLVVRANAKVRSFDFGTKGAGPHKSSVQVGFHRGTISVQTEILAGLPSSQFQCPGGL